MPSVSLDWEKVRPDAISTLQSLVQFNTVNPPGAEEPAIDYQQDLLQKEGITTEILAAEPTRDNLLARLSGSGKEPPLLLMSHVDVVGVEPDKWSVHPFSGAIDNGYLYGRGAIDDKGMAAAEAMVLLLLKRLNVKLKRDVIYLAAADEESGGRLGIAWLITLTCVGRTLLIMAWVARGTWKRGLHRELHGAPLVPPGLAGA